MNLSIDLPEILEEQLSTYCHVRSITESQAIQCALHQFLSDSISSTPYELGLEGFGADRTHSGDIARNSQKILRERFRDSTTR